MYVFPPFRHSLFDKVVFNISHVIFKIPFVSDDMIMKRALPLEFGKGDEVRIGVFWLNQDRHEYN